MSAIRVDRLVTLSLMRPLQRVGGGGSSCALPILMYHSISEDEQAGVAAYYKTVTRPAVFEMQMRHLHEAGFRATSLEEALPALQSRTAAVEKRVAITFDDGFRDFHDHAVPVLQRFGQTATVFLPTAFIDNGRKCFKGRECMTWDEVRALRSQGMRFGSHTVNHPVLHDLSWREIESELVVSRERLEQQLGETVTSFAYPYALPQEDRVFTGTLEAVLRDLGYTHGVTTQVGRARPDDKPLLLKRLPVNNCDDTALLAAKLAGSYDWFGQAQLLVRHAKRWGRRRRSHAPVVSPVSKTLPTQDSSTRA